MTFIDEPDEDGTHECPKCKGLGVYSGTVLCPYCDGNKDGKRRVCDLLLQLNILENVCEGTPRLDGSCILAEYACLRDNEEFWTEIDCVCEKGRLFQKYIKCTQCNGEGRLDWVQMVTSKARDEEE